MGAAAARDIAGAVFAELDRLIPDGLIGIAVSGGGDSIALLVLTARWAHERGREISVATVDHGLRGDSAAEAADVAKLCAKLGVAHTILQAENLCDVGGNLSAAARSARFALLGELAKERSWSAVLLGHTMDDQAETVLMRLARGSGAEGLSAMQSGSRRSGMLWLRPLLGIRREALREFLQIEGIGWIEDPTNEDAQFDRVKARQALAFLAPLGIDAEGLARTAWHLQRQRRVLERAMEDLARGARHWGEFGEASLEIPAMIADEYDTALRLFADTLRQVSGAVYRPRFRVLSDALARIMSEHSLGRGVGLTLSGCLIRSDADTIQICREPNACKETRSLSAGAMIWDRRWSVTVDGNWPPSAHLGPLGDLGLKMLRASLADGHWSAPESWASAPGAVRQSTPAIWLIDRAGVTDLLAAPLAEFLNRRTIGSDCAIIAKLSLLGRCPEPSGRHMVAPKPCDPPAS